jgi:hypothetical protein
VPQGRTRPEHLGSPRPLRVAPCTRSCAGPRPCHPSIAILSATCQFSTPLVCAWPSTRSGCRLFKVTGRSPHAHTRSTRRSGGTIRHHVPLTLPALNDPSAPSYDFVTSTTPRLDPVEAQTTPCCAAVSRASPEHAPSRPPPPGATRRARQRHPRPVSGLKPMRGEFMVTSPPFPRPPAPLARRILAETTAPQGQGPHCRAFVLSRVFCAI